MACRFFSSISAAVHFLATAIKNNTNIRLHPLASLSLQNVCLCFLTLPKTFLLKSKQLTEHLLIRKAKVGTLKPRMSSVLQWTSYWHHWYQKHSSCFCTLLQHRFGHECLLEHLPLSVGMFGFLKLKCFL